MFPLTFYYVGKLFVRFVTGNLNVPYHGTIMYQLDLSVIGVSVLVINDLTVLIGRIIEQQKITHTIVPTQKLNAVLSSCEKLSRIKVLWENMEHRQFYVKCR
jgi:hypothetical protein